MAKRKTYRLIVRVEHQVGVHGFVWNLEMDVDAPTRRTAKALAAKYCRRMFGFGPLGTSLVPVVPIAPRHKASRGAVR